MSPILAARLEIEGTTVGACLATFNANYQNFALNRNELTRLLDAKESGKVIAAFVVETKMRTCLGVVHAVKLADKLRNVPCRMGPYGEFWTAPSFSDEEEPF
jgi:hypothetical protein